MVYSMYALINITKVITTLQNSQQANSCHILVKTSKREAITIQSLLVLFGEYLSNENKWVGCCLFLTKLSAIQSLHRFTKLSSLHFCRIHLSLQNLSLIFKSKYSIVWNYKVSDSDGMEGNFLWLMVPIILSSPFLLTFSLNLLNKIGCLSEVNV